MVAHRFPLAAAVVAALMALSLGCLPAGALSSTASQPDTGPVTCTYGGYAELPASTGSDGLNVGGLSGLDIIGTQAFAISDDATAPRIYELDLGDPATGRPAQALAQQPLRDADGESLTSANAEALRMLGNGTFLWADEGVATNTSQSPAGLHLADRDGRLLRSFHVPDYHQPSPDATQGVRPNQGPEALAVIGDSAITVNEAALAQDGPLNTEQTGMLTRLTSYDIATGEPRAEYLLEVGPLYLGAVDRGIADIVATNVPGRFLVLERGYLPGVGNRASISQIDLTGATNVLGTPAIDGSEIPVAKQLVFDFTDAPEHPDNVEGMAWDTRAGHEGTLWVVSDNNFNAHQRTLLHQLHCLPGTSRDEVEPAGADHPQQS